MVNDTGTGLSDAAGLADAIERLKLDGYAVLPRRLDDLSVAAARDELGGLLAAAPWGSGAEPVSGCSPSKPKTHIEWMMKAGAGL